MRPAPKPAAAPAQPAEPSLPAERIALIAIDLDGTLLRSDKALTRRSADAVIAAAAKGVRVILASARPPRSVRRVYDTLGLDTLQINYNGALIHDARRNRNVAHKPLSSQMATQIVRYARKMDPDVVVSVEILDKWYTDHFDDTLPTETAHSFAPDFVGPLEAFLHKPVTKLMLLAPPARLTPIRHAVEAKFEGKMALTLSDHHLVQITHPEVDKGRALAEVASMYGVPRQQVMAIGDAPNDLGMLRWAGLGVAVQNAWREVREAVSFVVPSNDEDGVAVAIERYVMKL